MQSSNSYPHTRSDRCRLSTERHSRTWCDSHALHAHCPAEPYRTQQRQDRCQLAKSRHTGFMPFDGRPSGSVHCLRKIYTIAYAPPTRDGVALRCQHKIHDKHCHCRSAYSHQSAKFRPVTREDPCGRRIASRLVLTTMLKETYTKTRCQVGIHRPSGHELRGNYQEPAWKDMQRL